MATGDGTEEIADDELLLRRIPAADQWYDRRAGRVHPLAFRPNLNDTTGLSFSRSKYRPGGAAEEAAKGRDGNEYFVAVLRAVDLRGAGIVVEPRPLSGEDAGHAELPAVTYQKRKSSEVVHLIHQLRSLVIRVEGPFPGKSAAH